MASLYFDLHRHDHGSTYDGFGDAKEAAEHARELGYTALGLTNHGTTMTNIQHYYACREVGIKPIMGVEAYFSPTFDSEKIKEAEYKRGHHLCLFAKNLVGYKNINEILTRADQNNRYYVGHVTFDLLQEFSEGVICSSACVSGYLSRAVLKENYAQARKAAQKFKSIFGDDFYIEVQPYKIDEDGTQETVNERLIDLADELDIKTIMTSDSHRPRKNDIDAYLMMWQMARKDTEHAYQTYKDRYMPSQKDIVNRFYKMHHGKGNAKVDFSCANYARRCCENLQDIANKVEGDILDQLELEMPKISYEIDSHEELLTLTQHGLKMRFMASQKYFTKARQREYIKRCRDELKVIRSLGFEDYFLMVQDYTVWAKEQGIVVGGGRGSCCNSLVCWALRITEVDSIKYGLDFNRFMREGKVKIPDIDLDFESSRRDEVIKYILAKYPGRAAQVSSYSKWTEKVLCNELIKHSGITQNEDKFRVRQFLTKFCVVEEELQPLDYLRKDHDFANMIDEFNARFNNIIDNFYRFYGKIKNTSMHAAGVAITARPLTWYTAQRFDTKSKNMCCVHDLVDIDMIHVVKFDVLGLKTLSKVKDMREATGVTRFDEAWTEDEKIMEMFAKGMSHGIFQFGENACRGIMEQIQVSCFNDVVATNAMNRPAALSLQMPDRYARMKLSEQTDSGEKPAYWEYVQDTYGCILYQEQTMAIAINIGGFTADEADILVKMEHGATSRTKRELDDKYYKDFKEKFVKNAVEYGLSEEDATKLFDACSVYGFNKGHSVGYALMAIEEAYYKVYYPAAYWFTRIKYINRSLKTADRDEAKYCILARADDVLLYLPHVQLSDARTALKVIDGEQSIVKGLDTLKGIGDKACVRIIESREKQGKFRGYQDFYDRCYGGAVKKNIIQTLKDHGALEFSLDKYYSRVIAYNSELYRKAGIGV